MAQRDCSWGLIWPQQSQVHGPSSGISPGSIQSPPNPSNNLARSSSCCFCSRRSERRTVLTGAFVFFFGSFVATFTTGLQKKEEKKIECANAKLHRTNISSTEGAYCSLLTSSDALVSVGGARAGLTTETTPPSTSSMASSEWMQSLRLLPSNAGIFVVTVSFFGGFLACFFFDAFTTVLQQKKGKLSGST